MLTVGVLLGVQSAPTADSLAYRPTLGGQDRLLTNEYAHSNPADHRAVRSDDWDVTSGSLFLRDGTGWTGSPDAASPDAGSANGTGSSVFRATTKRSDFGDALVSFRVKNEGLTSRGRMRPAATDGIHVFLRWHSPEDLYVVSVNRRDNRILVKRKSPGGEVNGGTYATLGQAPYTVPYGRWQTFRILIENTAGHTATISVDIGGRTLLKVVDQGTAAPVNLTAGSVGLRGDNCAFHFDSFRVLPLSAG
ncbi:hypothetical protein [Actinoplanes sp. NPDC049599]|uniref:hypothetical protein n=1 Tax=Actinoplanes sp. NPDC049599 TaxID=3363903 RepID=UPI0037B9BD2D